MNREDALLLLRGGKEKVDEWNRRRKSGEAIPSLTGADFIATDLRGADLSRADLTKVYFHEARLYLADFSGADLSHATFSNSKLYSAVLCRADLTGAYFDQTNVERVNFENACLVETILERTHLKKANLSGARFTRTRLYGTDFGDSILRDTLFIDTVLSSALGLEEARHRGPSTVDIDTILNSKGEIPKAFLRGCGVPESLIVQIPRIVGCVNPVERYLCFATHAPSDRGFVRRLYNDLQKRGIRCWLDERKSASDGAAASYAQRSRRLRDRVILCCSTSALGDSWVETELRVANSRENTIEQEKENRSSAVILLDLDGFVRSSRCDARSKALIAAHTVVPFNGWEANEAVYEAGLETLARTLVADVVDQ